jgi:hypothetical protein
MCLLSEPIRLERVHYLNSNQTRWPSWGSPGALWWVIWPIYEYFPSFIVSHITPNPASAPPPFCCIVSDQPRGQHVSLWGRKKTDSQIPVKRLRNGELNSGPPRAELEFWQAEILATKLLRILRCPVTTRSRAYSALSLGQQESLE